MSHRRPTVACLLFLLFISPLCGVAQTPDWGMIYLIILSRRRFRHPIGAFLISCLRASWVLFWDWLSDRGLFSCMIITCYVIPVLMMFASTFKVLTGLSLAIVLATFLAWRGALRRQPRNLRNGDSSLAKIGVILVSCSCGKWSPIDADETQTASAINH